MSLEFSYNVRHLLTRKLTTMMTIVGVALVVFVFVASIMLSDGLKQTLASTGSAKNLIAVRLGSQNEVQSNISREHAGIILSQPEVERLADGSPFASTDNLVLVSLRKRSDNQPSNVNIRGVSPQSFKVREGISIIEGRVPAPGTREILVGSAIRKKFIGTEIGQSIRLVGTEWQVVGVFDAGNSGFSSEIWGDVDILMPSFRREQFSSVTFRLKNPENLAQLKERLENDKRLSITLTRENEFYEAQSEMMGKFIKYLGIFVSIIFSLGAIVGSMITMYSAVAGRTREIGILRALGFSGGLVFFAFIKECVLISLLGGILGILLAALLSWVQISTTNFATFAEVAFGFTLSTNAIFQGILFSIIMGVVGGALPAYRASRIKVLDALKAI